MAGGLRPRGPRHATVVAYLALFVALGGTAYASNEWTGANIVDETITGADIKGKAGTAADPAVNGSITTYDIAGQAEDAGNGTPFVNGTISTWDVHDGTLNSDDLASGSVDTAELAPDSVTGAKVANGSLTGADLVNGSILSQQIASGAITGNNVLDGDLTGADIEDDSLTGADVGPNAVGQSEIATDGVAATEIADNSIDTGEIVDNSLFAADLAPSSAGNSELAANAVDSSKVSDNTLTLSDLKGINTNGSVSFTAGGIPIGGCKDFSISTGGSKVGEAVIVSLRGAVAEGMLFYGVRVATDDHAIMKVCNFTGATSPAITNLPIKVVTFG